MVRFLFAFIICAFALMTVSAQSPSPAPNATPTETPSSSPSPKSDERLREGLKSMAEESRNLTGWGLAIIGASIIGIASTSYMRPPSRRVRLIYLLFIPGWLLTAWSVYNGDQITRSHSAAIFAKNRELLGDIGSLMNTQFINQLSHLQWGLAFFGIWLLVYAIWWIFADLPATK